MNIAINLKKIYDTIWQEGNLTRENLAEIYATTPQNISLHVGNIYQDKELDEEGILC